MCRYRARYYNKGINKLFERFIQRGDTRSTGVGLAITKHLVDPIRGSIRFRSDPTIKPGRSCVMKMDLQPCQPPRAELNEDSNIIIEETIA